MTLFTVIVVAANATLAALNLLSGNVQWATLHVATVAAVVSMDNSRGKKEDKS